MNHRPYVATAALLAAAALCPLRAQAPGSATTPPGSLHEAWLAEVMDLDVGRAVKLYTRVANDPRPGNLERWVASARLAELQRLGVTPAVQLDLAEAPPSLREVLTASRAPLDTAPLVDRTKADPAALLQTLATEAGKLPALRPAVPAAETWLLEQGGPSLRDRYRERMQSLASRARAGSVNRFTDRVYAPRVLQAELAGRRQQADAQRSLYFPDWQPPTISGDSAAHLAKVRANLEAWSRERELTGSQQALLQALREALERAAAKDPAEALQLVLRLPHYAERLLREPTTDGR